MPVSTALSPGALLASEIYARGWTVAQFGAMIGAPPELVEGIIDGRTYLDLDLSARIGAAMGSSPRLWLKLQARYLKWEDYMRRERAKATA